jgi:hypothetical protein
LFGRLASWANGSHPNVAGDGKPVDCKVGNRGKAQLRQVEVWGQDGEQAVKSSDFSRITSSGANFHPTHRDFYT